MNAPSRPSPTKDLVPSRPNPSKDELFNGVKPETDQEATFLLGLGLIALGFGVAQLLGSILFVPLSLIVPGSVLTLVSLRAQPVEESE